ncbi:hypothetical protein [Roseovarius sp. MMSF_3350]|uniref:hypothetical protein n=1 Tax=Roseovarius sp. MMSF_3350 TaxID=3046706 RepID=UPI00273E68EB|nr:hypothetical protein [Roseovarius sp. MMSF_3350]
MRNHKNQYPEAVVLTGPVHRDVSADACRQLWCAVLQHGIATALRAIPRTDRALVSSLEIQRARSWIGTPDFRLVCELAGIDPAYAAARVGLRLAQLGAKGGAA